MSEEKKEDSCGCGHEHNHEHEHDNNEDNNDDYMKNYEKNFEEGKKLKNEGDLKFKTKNYEDAIKEYEKAVEILKKINVNDEKQKEGAELFVKVYSNLSNCYNQIKKYDKVLLNTKEGLNFVHILNYIIFNV